MTLYRGGCYYYYSFFVYSPTSQSWTLEVLFELTRRPLRTFKLASCLAARTSEIQGTRTLSDETQYAWRFQDTLYIRPGENLASTMHQPKLNLLDQNLIPNQFWGRSGARKVCPQAVLGPGPGRLTGG